MAEILVFSKKMAPGSNNTNAHSPIEVMKNNYKKLEDISADVKDHGIDEYLDFNNLGRFEFFHCEECTGPMLGHIQTKC